MVASAGGDDRALLLRVRAEQGQLEVLRELTGHTDTVDRVGFSTDGKLLATGSLDGKIKIWKIKEDGEKKTETKMETETDSDPLQELEPGDGEISWMAWHPVGSVIVAGTNGGSVWVWHAESGQCMFVLGGGGSEELEGSTAGCWSTDGKQLVAGYGNGTVCVWRLPRTNTFEPVQPLVRYKPKTLVSSAVVSLCWHPTNPVVAVGFQDGRLALLHASHEQVVQSSQLAKSASEGAEEDGDENCAEHLCFMSRPSALVVGALDGLLRVLDGSSWQPRMEVDLGAPITAMLMQAVDPLLAVGCQNGNVAIIDLRTGKIHAVQRIDVDGDVVYSLLWLDQSTLLASYEDGSIRLLRL